MFWEKRAFNVFAYVTQTAHITLLLTLFSIIALVSLPNRVHSMEEDMFDMSIEELMDIPVSTSTKTAKPISATPGSITVITRQQIEFSGATTLPDLLRGVAGVNVRWNPMAETIDIRGFGENPLTNRVLLLIDGVPYNSQSEGGFPQHIGFDFFNLKNVKQVEVIRGGGSALYGENAYWGIVNIESLSGGDLEGVRLAVSSGDRETSSASVLAGSQFEDGEWLISTQFLNTQLPHEFWYKENNSHYEGRDLFLKLDYKQHTFSYYRHQAENDGFTLRFGDKIQNSVFQSADLIEETIDIVSYKTEQSLSDNTQLHADLSYTQRRGTQCSACHAATQYPDSSSVGEHGRQFIGDAHIKFSGIDNHTMLLGVEQRWVDAGDDRTELIDYSVDAEERVLDYKKTAVYMQDQISLMDDDLSLLVGARFDGETDPDLFKSNISPRLAAVYKINEKRTLKAGISRSFHFPDFSTLYLNRWFLNEYTPTQSASSIDFVANTDLKPEEIITVDMGLSALVNENLSVNLSLFHSQVNEFIVMVFKNYDKPAVDEVYFENHPGDGRVSGGEIEFNYKMSDHFLWNLNYSLQFHEQTDSLRDSSGVYGNPGKLIEFSYAPNRKLNMGVSFADLYGFSGSLELQWKDEFYAPSIWYIRQPYGPLDDYIMGHASLKYHFKDVIQSGDQIILSGFARNLFDETPEETLLGLNDKIAGREFFMGLEYRFDFE